MEHKVPREPKRKKKKNKQSTTSKTVLSSLCLSFWADVISKGTEVKAHNLCCRLCWQVDLRFTEDERTAAFSTKQRRARFSGWFRGSLQPRVDGVLTPVLETHFWVPTIQNVLICPPFSLPVRDNGLGSCLSVSAAECDQPEAAAGIGPCP